MNKREFINLLVNALDGRVPNSMINEKAGYYRDYITGHAAKRGISEADVIAELGSPEAIAFTIIEVYEDAHGPYSGPGYSGSFGGFGTGSEPKTDFDENGERVNEGLGGLLDGIRSLFSGQYGCLLLLFLFVVVGIAVISWVLKFMAAYPLLALAVILVFYMRKNKRR